MTTSIPAPPRLSVPTERTLALDRPIDLRTRLGPLARGSGDPTMRVAAIAAIRASMTPDGPGTIDIRESGMTVRASAWGPGGAWLLDQLPAALGLDDDDAGFEPSLHPRVAALAHQGGP